ncbi:MAG: signal peptidase I [Candidatus Magnetoovum sp. WYHC-5]|nr:signal peptidase I [Candidatus Magnetoovum sp. WYHC-5]
MIDKKRGFFRDYAEPIITALILALLIRAFVIQAFKIPSGSMIPTLLVGDHILVNKFIYGLEIPFTNKKILPFRDPQRGDVIVFKFPEDTSRDFIKRVVARGGDTLEIKNQVVYVNGKALEENYIQHVDNVNKGKIPPRDNLGPIVVPESNLFVMGDNRDQSYDSRFWGFVSLDNVRGEALIIYWSWDKDKKVLPFFNGWVRFNRIGRLVE